MRKILVFILLLSAASPTFLLSATSSALAGHGSKHIFVTINGLVCDFCARSMEKVFLKKDPVSGIKVDLTSKTVTIDLKKDAVFSDDDIKKGVTDAGYTVVSIKRD